MNLKLRFALLFTGFVAIILVASSISIYILYYNYRMDDYYARMKSEGLETYSLFLSKGSYDSSTVIINNKVNTNVLYQESVWIMDANYHTLLHQTVTNEDSISNTVLAKAKKNGEYRFQRGLRQFVVIYMPDVKQYVYISAYDRYGLKRLNNIKLILALVLCGGLLITALVSFIFVREAFKPLKKLSKQMENTTGDNMTGRIEEGKGNDEIKQIARNFNSMLDRLKRSFDLQKSFVNHASHELRTPLAVMLSQTENAINKNLDAEGYKKLLIELKEDQNEIIDLTNSLLLLSQYERLSFSNNWNEVRIDEVLYESIDMAKQAFAGISIKVDFDNIPQEEYLRIRGNDSLIGSLFRNLIKNAWLYSDNKEVSIRVNAVKEKVEILISNTGSLLTLEEQDRLFIPFFRGDNALQKKGHGLGLAIVSRIVEAHKGTIKYEPINDKINRFTIAFFR